MAKYKGSGGFAVVVGICFLVALWTSRIYDLRSISPYLLFQAWLLFAGAILLGWGVNRIRTGEVGWQVGQPTLNFVVGIIGATLAFLALVKHQ